MNDDIKKALELAPLGYKADHAQLWMHLQILAEHIKNEPARTKTANEAAIMEWRAGAADRDELRADCEQRIEAAMERRQRRETLRHCEHGAEFEHLTNCEKCVNSVLDKL